MVRKFMAVLLILGALGLVVAGIYVVKESVLKIQTSSEFSGYTLKLFSETELRRYLREAKIEQGLSFEGKQVAPKSLEVILTDKQQPLNVEQPPEMEAFGSVGLAWEEKNKELKVWIQSMPALWKYEDGNRHVAAQFLRIINSMIQKEFQKEDLVLFEEYKERPVFFI